MAKQKYQKGDYVTVAGKGFWTVDAYFPKDDTYLLVNDADERITVSGVSILGVDNALRDSIAAKQVTGQPAAESGQSETGAKVDTPMGQGIVTGIASDTELYVTINGTEFTIPIDKLTFIDETPAADQPATAPVATVEVETPDGKPAEFVIELLQRAYTNTVIRGLATFGLGDITKNENALNALVEKGYLTGDKEAYRLTQKGTLAAGGDWLMVRIVHMLPQNYFDGSVLDVQRLLAQVFDQFKFAKHDIAALTTKCNSLEYQVERTGTIRDEHSRMTVQIEKLKSDLEAARNNLPPLTEVTVLRATNEKLTKELESLKIINQKIANSTTGKLHAQLAEANAEIARLRLYEQEHASAPVPAADVPVIAMGATPVKVEMQFITTNYLFPEEVKRLEDAVNNGGWSMVYETISNGVHVARLERDIDDDDDDEPGEPIVKQAPAVNPGAFSDFVNTLDLDDDTEVLHVEGVVIADEPETVPAESQRLIEAGHETGHYDTGAILGALANELRVKHEQRVGGHGS